MTHHALVLLRARECAHRLNKVEYCPLETYISSKKVLELINNKYIEGYLQVMDTSAHGAMLKVELKL